MSTVSKHDLLHDPEPSFIMSLRNRWFKVTGYIDPADPSVGIGDYFICSNLEPLDGGPSVEPESLTDRESDLINTHFWEMVSCDESYSDPVSIIDSANDLNP
jgi:hypothetical protein